MLIERAIGPGGSDGLSLVSSTVVALFSDRETRGDAVTDGLDG